MKTKEILLAAFLLLPALPYVSALPVETRKEPPVSLVRYESRMAVETSIIGRETATYHVMAYARQHMTVKLKALEGACDVTIYAPGRRPGDQPLFNGSASGNTYSGIVPATGDYTVTVSARTNEWATYVLEIFISSEKASDSIKPPQPKGNK